MYLIKLYKDGEFKLLLFRDEICDVLDESTNKLKIAQVADKVKIYKLLVDKDGNITEKLYLIMMKGD